MTVAGISVFCATYQRCPYPLEEIVYCFINQDYPKKDMVVYNDDPDVVIKFDHPEVNIINGNKRHGNVYEKVNTGRRHCKYDIIMNWGDDDLYMPHGLSTTMRYFQMQNKPVLALIPYYKSSPKECNLVSAIVLGNIVSTQEAWEECGGYNVNLMKIENLTKPVGNDKVFLKESKRLNLYSQKRMKDDEAFFIWRFSLHYPWKRRNWDIDDEEKFKVKERSPKIVELKPKRGKYATKVF